MEMKDRIKEQRLKLGLTQEELAERLDLKKSAIAKYENGRVENIKRSMILKMSELFGCSPCYLMALDDPDVEDSDTAPSLRPDERRLLVNYNLLNEVGRVEALQRVQEMTEVEKYRKDTILLNA